MKRNHRPRHPATTIAITALLLAACGGDALVALLPVIGPIGGQWQLDAAPGSATLEPRNGEIFNVSPTGADAATYPTQPNYAVRGDFTTASGACAAAVAGDPIEVAGSVTGDRLVLSRFDDPAVECLRARFTDVRTLEVNSTTRYRNSTVQFQLDSHEWTNADDPTQRFRFTQAGDAGDGDPTRTVDLAGCRRISGGAPVPFTATLEGYNTRTGIGPRLANFSIDGAVFATGEFKNLTEIDLVSAAGSHLTLRRVAVQVQMGC